MTIRRTPPIVDTSQDPAFNTPQQVNKSPNTTGIVGPLIDSEYVNRRNDVINEPGGNVGMVQYSLGSSFGGDRNFTYNANTKTLNLSGNIVLGGFINGRFTTNLFNFKVTGGANGQILTTDGAGNLSWQDQAQLNYSNANVANYLPNYNGPILANYISIPAGNANLANINTTGTANITYLNINDTGALTLDVTQLKMAGGSPGQILRTDGTGNVNWEYATGLQNYLQLGNTAITLDQGGSNSVWNGPFDTPPSVVGGFVNTDGGNNALMTYGTDGAGYMSIATDGSLFVGENVGNNSFGYDYNEPGWVVVERGVLITDQAGSIIFPDGTQQFTAYTGDIDVIVTSLPWSNITDKPNIPASLLDLSITDGVVGQVLTTNGNGAFTFENIETIRLFNIDGGSSITFYDSLGLNIDGGSSSSIYNESELVLNGGGA